MTEELKTLSRKEIGQLKSHLTKKMHEYIDRHFDKLLKNHIHKLNVASVEKLIEECREEPIKAAFREFHSNNRKIGSYAEFNQQLNQINKACDLIRSEFK